MFVCGESGMNEEFQFEPHGTRGRLMTFTELEEAVRATLQNDIDAVERRIIQVAAEQQVDIIDRRSRKEQDMIGHMKAGDILIKFR